MGLGVRVDGKNAEKARLHLIGQDLIAYGCRIHQEGGMVTFPVKDTTSPAHLEGIGHIGASLVQFEHVVPDTFGWNSLAKNLEGIIDADEVKHLITSFDVIGDIAAIEIPDQFEAKELAIANAILKMNKHVKSVCKKLGAHEGQFRVQKVKPIGGEGRTETIHAENGVRMRLDLGKSYYSPRMANDRLIIAKQVKPGEVIGSLFGGIGPFALIMAKKQPEVTKIYSVELNPDAHHYAQGNVVLNKLQGKVEAILMDAVLACSTILAGICDRVCLPVPKEISFIRLFVVLERDFLQPGLQALKPTGGYVHLYQFTPDDDPFSGPIEKFRKAAANIGI